MSKVKEFFGFHTKRSDVDWKEILLTQSCPYTEKKCVKVRKSNPEVSIGVCTVEYSKYKEVMICPHRLLERRQIFTDCVHLLTTVILLHLGVTSRVLTVRLPWKQKRI
jgi:hypothetical protein